MINQTRRTLLTAMPALTGAATILGFTGSRLGALGQAVDGKPPASFPRQDEDAVSAIVSASHTQLERVQALVSERPALAKASWDWGFGDWESALGAASHMGRRDIAEVLMAHGARPTIFTFAMLGALDVVRALVSGHPGIQHTPGPHGITLLAHARVSASRNDDEAARAMVDYLESLGDADPVPTSLELSDDAQAAYLGHYRIGRGPEEVLVVERHRQGWLMLRRGDASGRRLHRVEAHGFAPAGAPSVRVRFEVVGDRAVSVTVHDPAPLVTGTRVTG